MNIKGRMIGGKYYEAAVDSASTGTLSELEALEFAEMLLLTAEEILYNFRHEHVAQQIGAAQFLVTEIINNKDNK